MIPIGVKPLIGQECICPDGLGRVVNFATSSLGLLFVKVDTYICNRSCEWDPKNITLIEPILLRLSDGRVVWAQT